MTTAAGTGSGEQRRVQAPPAERACGCNPSRRDGVAGTKSAYHFGAMTHEHEGEDGRWMRSAIEAAERGIAAGQTPFGASIVRDGRLVVAAHNVVWATTDITAHAEVNAIRLACRELGTIDLSGCDIFCTCEPCPMCFGAIHWARFDRLVYAASVADAANAGFG